MQSEYNALVEVLRDFFEPSREHQNPYKTLHDVGRVYVNYTRDFSLVLGTMTSNAHHMILRLADNHFSIRVNDIIDICIQPESSMYVKLPYDMDEEGLFQASTLQDLGFVTVDVVQELTELRSVLKARYV